MPRRSLLVGPQFPALETAAFDRLSPNVGDSPRSLLYISRQGVSEQRIRSQWRNHGCPLSISVETFDRIVGDCYEQATFAGSSTHIDQALRDRLVEVALEQLEDPSNPLTVRGFPSSGLCQQVEQLHSLMAFADLHTPDDIRTRLEAEGLPIQARALGAVAEALQEARDRVLPADELRTNRAERYHHVLSDSPPLSDSLPAVDAVIFAGFTLFSPLEQRLVERIATTWPSVAILPQLTDTEEPVGADRGMGRAVATYEALDFVREFHQETTPAGLGAAQQLYRPAESGPEIDAQELTASMTLAQPETIPQEIRYVAREIRERLGAGAEPNDIGIVLPDPSGYQERLVETFDEYQIPSTLATERSFGETAVGEVIAQLATLSRGDPPITAVTALFANPLVTGLGTVDGPSQTTLARIANRLSSRRLATMYPELDDEVAQGLESLVDDATALRTTSLAALPSELHDLLSRLGVTDTLDDLPQTPRGRTEQAAAETLDRALETLEQTDGEANLVLGDPVERLERALAGTSIETEASREDGQVLICGLETAVPRMFDHLYILGLTDGRFPSNPDRLAFTQPINEAHPDFEQADIQQGARYDLGLLIASGARLTLSIPERDLDGDPYVEADIITELRRVTELELEPVSPAESQPGSREDVQRSLSRTIAHAERETYAAAIDEATAAPAFAAFHRRRLQKGVACAAARAISSLTAYDGDLSPETVATLHGEAEREPYSPSRLETYAACGFKYYMANVLDIEEPDDITLEPDSRARGGFLHDVVEHYYAELQSAPGDTVESRGDWEAREEGLLNVANDRLSEWFGDTSTAFQREWLIKVFAGLGSESENDYYGDDAYGTAEKGVLARFLKHEFEEVAKATALPAWFEPRVGEPRGDEPVLSEQPISIDTPHGTVPLVGQIDRIDMVEESATTQLVVRDYKTGNTTPSESDTLGGVKFQLPLYATLAETTLQDVTTVGGAYYKIKPPTSVNHRKGLIGSQEHADWAGYDEVDTPISRYQNPAFQTPAAFRRFVEDTIPDRLGQLATGIGSGRYHPTVLDPDDAGCRYCGYQDVCDVRPHRRQAVIEAIDDEGISAYVPLAARGTDIEDVLEVN